MWREVYTAKKIAPFFRVEFLPVGFDWNGGI